MKTSVRSHLFKLSENKYQQWDTLKCATWYKAFRRTSVIFLQKMHNLNPTVRKYHKNPSRGKFQRWLAYNLQKIWRQESQRKTENYSTLMGISQTWQMQLSWFRTGPFWLNWSEVWGLDGSNISYLGFPRWCLAKLLQQLHYHTLLGLSLEKEDCFLSHPQHPRHSILLP